MDLRTCIAFRSLAITQLIPAPKFVKSACSVSSVLMSIHVVLKHRPMLSTKIYVRFRLDYVMDFIFVLLENALRVDAIFSDTYFFLLLQMSLALL